AARRGARGPGCRRGVRRRRRGLQPHLLCRRAVGSGVGHGAAQSIVERCIMIRGFKDFLLKNDVRALAVAVIIGGAVGKVVSSLAADILMPIIGLGIPGGEWRSAKIILNKVVGPDGKEVVNAINYGTFMGSVIDFIIIAFVVYMMTKSL